jgi:uncharacterized membrane protein
MADDEHVSGGGLERRGAYEVGRLLAFSDGVFAIAITLLVLSIPIPQLAPGQANRLAEVLLAQAPNLAGFVLSFVLVGAQWIIHHRLLRGVVRCDGGLLWLNVLLLMFICLIPFSSSVLIRYGGIPIASQVYAANLTFVGLGLVAVRVYLTRRGDLTDGRAPMSRRDMVLGPAAPLFFLASIPVASRSVTGAQAMWLVSIGALRLVGAAPWRRRGRRS